MDSTYAQEEIEIFKMKLSLDKSSRLLQRVAFRVFFKMSQANFLETKVELQVYFVI